MNTSTNMNTNSTSITSTPPKVRVCAYLRVSSEEQVKNGFGIDAQKYAITEYIKSKQSKGWEFNPDIHLFVDEGISGSTDDRPSLNRMKQALLSREIDLIIVNSFDRLFRDVKHCLTFIDLFCAEDVEILSITEPSIDTKSPEGRMFLSFSQTIAENERNKIAIRTMAGKRIKASQGYSVSGIVPFGFKREKSERPTIHESESAIIKRLFHMFVIERRTQAEIARTFSEEKVPTRSDIDSSSRKRSINGYGYWSQETISRYLKDEVYIGRGYFGKTTRVNKIGGGVKTIVLPKEKWIPQEYPVIIDKEIFEQAQEILKNRMNPPRKKECRKYLLTSILTCGQCGMGYQGYASGKGTIHYRCRGGKTTMKHENPCFNPQLSGTKMEKFVWNIVTGLLSNPSHFSKEFEKISNSRSKLSSYNQELVAINSELEDDSRKIKEAFQMKLSTTSDTARSACDDVILTIEGRLRHLETRKREIDLLIHSEHEKLSVSKDMQSLSTLYKKNLANIEKCFTTKERLIKTIIKRIEIHNSKVVIYFQFNNPDASSDIADSSLLIRMDYDRSLVV